MNIEKEFKKKELEIVKNTMTETLILSQQKSEEYLEEQRKLEKEINQLKENINKSKIIKTRIEIEGGWKQKNI